MRKTIFILLLASVIALSCEEKKALDYVIIKGVINDTGGDSLKITSRKGFSKSLAITDSVPFVDTLDIAEGLYYLRFKRGYSPVYMIPGQVVSFSADPEKHGRALYFDGDNASFNNYHSNKFQDIYTFKMKNKEHYTLEEPEFENLTKRLQQSAEAKLERVKNISEALKAQEKRALQYARINRKSLYETYHSKYAEKTGFKASEAFKKEINDLPLNNTADFFYSSDYSILVSKKIDEQARAIALKDSLSFPEAQLEAANELKDETIANELMYATANTYLPRIKQIKPLFDKYMAFATNTEQKQKINRLYHEIKQLNPGSPSPKFVNYENYKGGSTSLDDLKGKYVYIDIWATWCVPCIREFPFMKKIEEQYRNKNIHFVSISTDKQSHKDKWKKMIEEREMGGIQLITDNDFNASFIKKYKVGSIPQFMLIDPEGNIVQASAPRPSSKKLIDLFNELGI